MTFETILASSNASTNTAASDGPGDRRGERRPSRRAPDIRADLKALSKPSTVRAGLAVAEDWLLIAGAGAAVLYGWSSLAQGWGLLLVLAGWVLIGSRMRALATLLHESSHQTLSRRRKLNWAMGTVASGWWILQLRGRYIRSHIREHHQHLADPDHDPDTQQYLRQGLLKEDPDRFIPLNLLRAVTGAKTIVNLPYVLKDRLLPEPGSRLTRGEWAESVGFVLAWATLIALLAVNGWLAAFVLVWVVPYLTTFQALNWLIETVEHFPLIWTRIKPSERTRNRKGGAVERFFTGCHGENWHRVHHEQPGIPFFNLAKAHAVLMRDEAYAAFEAESAGLFTGGPDGSPSILKAIREEMRRMSKGAAKLEVEA